RSPRSLRSLFCRTPRRTLFPYTTLFRSRAGVRAAAPRHVRVRHLGLGRADAVPRPRPVRNQAALRHVRTLGNRARNSVCSAESQDRKSTRLNSSHVSISYAVSCLKKKTL